LAEVNTTLDVTKIREEFPILHQEVNGNPLVYFDNAATTQKPQTVIDELVNYYTGFNANIHRGVHELAEKATRAYEETRKTASAFINSNEPEEIIFTKGTTDGINLVASSYGRAHVGKGDEVIISSMEHHSNIVPWQLLCQEKGAQLKIIPITDSGELELDKFESLISEKTRIVSVVHASNSLGTINPIKEICQTAHSHGAVVVVDAAQAAPHLEINVQDLNVDFYAFSGHKMYGPTGVGVLYGKRRLLENMDPYQGGGEMINEVRFEKTTYAEIPYKFEAGTPNIAGVVAYKKAFDFINQIGKDNIADHENDLINHAKEILPRIDGFRFVGTAVDKVSVLSFTLDGIHPFDVGMMLDARGIAIRTGHHCTQPLMDLYNIEGTARASLAVYNTKEEIDRLADGLDRVIKMRRK